MPELSIVFIINVSGSAFDEVMDIAKPEPRGRSEVCDAGGAGNAGNSGNTGADDVKFGSFVAEELLK